ncbi:predicted protein, partial [Postia placenta Mad-698-R]
GGGIGGLCLAVALSRYPDIQVDVYEAAERFKEIGAGVMIWSRTWEILTLLGMASDFSQIAHATPDGSLATLYVSRSNGALYPVMMSICYIDGCIRFHRAQFLDVLVKHLPKDVAHFRKRLLSYSQEASDGHLDLQFQDGSTVTCDLLVGCDGIKSGVRRQMLKEKAQAGQADLLRLIEPVWTGTIAYRGLIPVHRLIRADGQEHRTIQTPMMSSAQHVVSYSISRGSVVNVVALVSYEGPWVTDCSAQELHECYAGWEPEVVDLISNKCIAKWTALQCIENPTRWAIHHLRPLPFYTTDRVVLLGDAAHAMSPHQGAGAGQAIEANPCHQDAFVLARVLGDPVTTMSTLRHAISAYEYVRLPQANRVLLGSHISGMMYEFDGPAQVDLQRLGPMIGAQWDWLNETTPEEEGRRALSWMQDRI